MRSPKIFFSLKGIDRDDWWWFDAACSIWCPGRIPDWQPSDYVLQGGVPSPHELRHGVN